MSAVKRGSSSGKAGRDEKAILKDIAEELTKLEQNRYNIGKLVEEFVNLKGGTKYGEDTVGKISRQLGIDSRQLRRYWDYYRLHSAYGRDLKQFGKSLSPSHYYVLARYLNAAELTPAQQKARIIQYAKVKKSKDDNSLRMTVDDFEKMISRDIDSLKNGYSDAPVAPKTKPPQPTSEPNVTSPKPMVTTPVEIFREDDPFNGISITPAAMLEKIETTENEWGSLLARMSEMGQDISANLDGMQRRIDEFREHNQKKQKCA